MSFITKTKQVDEFSPKIELKKRFKKVSVTGRSRMPDPGVFYSDLSNTLSDYFNEFNRTLFLEFYFDYINTGSSKWLLYLMQQLDSSIKEKGGMLEVTWKYDIDDEAIQETGELLKMHLSVPVFLKAV